MKPVRSFVVLGLTVVLAASAATASLAQPTRPGGPRQPGGQGQLFRNPDRTPFLGVAFEMTDEGVRVIEVVEGSPAEAAGLQTDDLITELDGQAIERGNLRDLLRGYSVGDTVELTIQRGEETVTLSVTLGENVAEGLRYGLRGRAQARIGAVLEEGTLTVAEVMEGSPAESAGLQVGDTITAINGTAVTTREEVLLAVAEVHRANDGAETAITITVDRDGEAVDLTATLPTRPALADRLPRFGRGMMGMLLQPNADGTGFNLVIPFTLPEGSALTPETQAAIEELGWTVQPKEGEDGVYELILPAENVRDGFNLPGLEMIPGMEGMEGMEFHFDFALPDSPETVPAEVTTETEL